MNLSMPYNPAFKHNPISDCLGTTSRETKDDYSSLSHNQRGKVKAYPSFKKRHSLGLYKNAELPTAKQARIHLSRIIRPTNQVSHVRVGE
jgi:hypothetical protein